MAGELAFPDRFVGQAGRAKVAYRCPCRAARAVEPAHLFAQMGTPLIEQIGTRGALDPARIAGDVMVPDRVLDRVLARDGLSHLYGAPDVVTPDAAWSDRARPLLADLGIPAVRGSHLT